MTTQLQQLEQMTRMAETMERIEALLLAEAKSRKDHIQSGARMTLMSDAGPEAIDPMGLARCAAVRPAGSSAEKARLKQIASGALMPRLTRKEAATPLAPK
jgi:hypothetical protein